MGIGAAILGAGVLGAGAKLLGINSAKKAQLQAADKSVAAQLAMFGITRKALKPFLRVGTKASNMLATNLNSIIQPINMDQETLENTPGYKFTLAQGEKAVQNSASARGLGVSGAAIKGAGEYAAGLASKTYQQQFENALANKQLAYNILSGTATIGANAGAGLSTAASAAGANIGSTYSSAGNVTGAADIAGGNAVAGLGNSLVNALLVKNTLGSGTQPIGVYS